MIYVTLRTSNDYEEGDSEDVGPSELFKVAITLELVKFFTGEAKLIDSFKFKEPPN